jgi:Protein of unknown function (DUF1553)
VPQQSLFMMNSPFVMDAAKSLVNREQIADESDPQRKIQLLYQTVLDRNASDDEMAMGLAFIESQAGASNVAKAQAKSEAVSTFDAWDKYAQVLLETNEFVFVD